MAVINKVMVGESLVGEGNEVAHIDLIIGPRGSAAETAFCNSLTNNKDGFTSLLAVIAPNLPCKPNTLMFNKVTMKDARQAVQMFGPAQTAVARAVADSVEDGTIPADEADDLFICVGVFIHWEAQDDAKIREYNSDKEILITVYLNNHESLPTILQLSNWIDCREGDETKLRTACSEVIRFFRATG